MSKSRGFLPIAIILLGAMLFACSLFNAVPVLIPTLAPTSAPLSTATTFPNATKAPPATAKPADTATPALLPAPTDLPTAIPVGLDGKTLLEQRCNACHPASYVAQLRGTADQWAGLVEMMVQNGADLSPQEEKVLASYLAQKYH